MKPESNATITNGCSREMAVTSERFRGWAMSLGSWQGSQKPDLPQFFGDINNEILKGKD
jgi:hypothetical protein